MYTAQMVSYPIGLMTPLPTGHDSTRQIPRWWMEKENDAILMETGDGWYGLGDNSDLYLRGVACS